MRTFEVRAASLPKPYETFEAEDHYDAFNRFLIRHGAEAFEAVVGTWDRTDGQNVLIPIKRHVPKVSDQELLFDAQLASVTIAVPHHSLAMLRNDWRDYFGSAADEPEEVDLFKFAEFIAYRYGNLNRICAEWEARHGRERDISEWMLTHRFVPEVKSVYANEIASLGYELEERSIYLSFRIMAESKDLNVYGLEREHFLAVIEENDPLTAAFRRSGWGRQ
jgi:hypothetical protein